MTDRHSGDAYMSECSPKVKCGISMLMNTLNQITINFIMTDPDMDKIVGSPEVAYETRFKNCQHH